MPLDPADKKFLTDLEKRVKKLEDRVKGDEKHVDKKLKSKKKKLPKAFGPEKAVKHADYLKRWADHDRLFNEAKSHYDDGYFPKGTHADLIDARRVLRKEGMKFRLRKDEEALGPDELKDVRRAEREARMEEAQALRKVIRDTRPADAPPGIGPSAAEIRRTKFPEADARYGVRPPVRASALGASVGSGLRYGRRF